MNDAIQAPRVKPVSVWLYRRRWPLLCSGGALLVIIACCAFLRISNLSDVQAYYGMVKNYDPIVKDFALRRFNQGDSMSDLLKRYPKKEAGKFGHFSVFSDYYWADPGNHTSFEAFARDGRLIIAEANGSVNGALRDFTFFHTTNDTEIGHECDREFEQYMKTHSVEKIPNTPQKP